MKRVILTLAIVLLLLNTNKGNEISHKNSEFELYRIANLTPSVGGNAVYISRAILKYEPKKITKGFEDYSYLSNKSDNVMVYPNPASSEVNITLLENVFEVGSQIEIFDIYGKIIKSLEINNLTNQIQVSIKDIEQGLYLFVIKNKNEVLSVSKVNIVR